MSEVINCSLFSVRRFNALYIFTILNNDLTETNNRLLIAAIVTICGNGSEKNSIIIDTTLTTTVSLVRKFFDQSLDAVSKMERQGLHRLVVVTSNIVLKGLVNAIINMKGSSSYSKICSSLPAAVQFVESK